MIEPGTLLQNRYRVAEQIGSGGMGAVYVATDERFNSKVAIKQTFFSDDPTLRKAFEREAHLLNHLRHNALPKVSDHFAEDAGQFLVMEFIEGADLGALLKERGGWFPVADVLSWADELLDALEYLHSREPRVIHRDIKPQNIKRTERGRIVLLDFGLAKGTPAQTQASATASVLGYSLHYAPLEQVQGTGTDPCSDLYSLGATLYHLLTGVLPVDALTRASAVINNQADPLRPAHLACPHVPILVSKVIQRALAQKASLRPRSAAEMREMLRQAFNAEPGASASVVFTRKRPATVEETVLESPAQLTDRMKSPPFGETTSDARRDVRHSTVTRVAPALYTPHEESPARRLSPKLLVAAAVLVVCAVAAFPLLRRSNSAANKTETQANAPQAAPSDAQGQAPAAGQAAAAGLSPSAAAPSSEQPQASASPSDSAQPSTGSTDSAGATNNGASNAGAAQTGSAAPAAAPPSAENRSPIVIQMVAPTPQPAAQAPQAAAPTPTQGPQVIIAGPSAYEEADRQAEERRRREMDRPMGPPGGGPPPPPMNGGPPPQFRPPPPTP